MLQSNAISPFGVCAEVGVGAEVGSEVDTDVFVMGRGTLEVLLLGNCVKLDDDD